jgi:hypothetical protein
MRNRLLYFQRFHHVDRVIYIYIWRESFLGVFMNKRCVKEISLRTILVSSTRINFQNATLQALLPSHILFP